MNIFKFVLEFSLTKFKISVALASVLSSDGKEPSISGKKPEMHHIQIGKYHHPIYKQCL